MNPNTCVKSICVEPLKDRIIRGNFAYVLYISAYAL